MTNDTDRGGLDAAAEVQSFVRHELRTPLAVMQPLLDMLLDGTSGPLGDKQLDHLRMLERNVERLAAMITSVVESGWLEVAAVPSRQGPVAVEDLVTDVVRDVRASLAVTPLVDAAAADDLPAISGDAYRLRRALRNVVVNACVYTPAGGQVRVSADPAPTGDRVAIVVVDNGPGVAAEELPRIFEVGYRGRAARASGVQGLGLGLPVARMLVEELGGRLVVETGPGGGTRVTLDLPAVV